MLGKPNTEVSSPSCARASRADGLQAQARRDPREKRQARMIEPGSAWFASRSSRSTPREPGAGRERPLQAVERRPEGPRARPRMNPAGCSTRPWRVLGVPAEECAGGLHRRAHRGREDAPHGKQGKLRARHLPRGLPRQAPARGQVGAARGCCERRLGVRLRDRRRRPAGPPPRPVIGTRPSGRAPCRPSCRCPTTRP